MRRGTNTKGIMMDLITTIQMDFNLIEYKDGLLKLDFEYALVSVLQMENHQLADVVIHGKVNILHGRDYINEKLGDLTFKISPFSFFKTNTKGAEVLYREVKNFIRDKR